MSRFTLSNLPKTDGEAACASDETGHILDQARAAYLIKSLGLTIANLGRRIDEAERALGAPGLSRNCVAVH